MATKQRSTGDSRRLRTWVPFLAAALLPAVLGGCTYGFLYSDTVRPLDRNMEGALFGSQQGTSQTKQLHDPFVSGVTVEWASRAIGDAARNGGIEEIQFADIHTVSILGGLFRTSTVLVYGEPAAGGQPLEIASPTDAVSPKAAPEQ